MVRGKPIKEIARLLNLAERTIRFYIEKIKEKANCHTKGELIDWALTNGFDQFLPVLDSFSELLKKIQ